VRPAFRTRQHASTAFLRGFYKHLLERVKSKRQALTAVARKLLHAIYGMFRSLQTYDGTRVYALPAPAENAWLRDRASIFYVAVTFTWQSHCRNQASE
jgi:hypothetical protein